MNFKLFLTVLFILIAAFSMRTGDIIMQWSKIDFSQSSVAEKGDELLSVMKNKAYAEEKGSNPHNKTPKDKEEKKEPVPVPESEATPEQIQQNYKKQNEQPDPYLPKFSDSEVAVLQSLAARRDELDKRARDLDQQALLLKATENRVEEKIAEMNKLKAELEALLQKQQEDQSARLAKLVKIYENMKPKDAAAIFDELEEDVLLGILDKMSERKSAPIIAAMDPVKARAVSLKLADQKALPEAAGN